MLRCATPPMQGGHEGLESLLQIRSLLRCVRSLAGSTLDFRQNASMMHCGGWRWFDSRHNKPDIKYRLSLIEPSIFYARGL